MSSGTDHFTSPDQPITLVRKVMSWARRHCYSLVAACWVASGLLYLTLPPSPDQFNHAYIGWRLLEGEAPYRDFIDMNWPGVLAVHALAIWQFGVNMWSWRALDFLIFAVSALLCADIARLIAGHTAFALSLILSPLMYAGAGYWVAGQHDMTAAHFLSGALWFHIRAYRKGKWTCQMGVGILLAAGVLNKPTVGILFAMLPLQCLWLKYSVSQVVTYTVVAGVTMLLAILAAFGVTISRGASVSDIIDAVYLYNITAQFFEVAPARRMLSGALFPGDSFTWASATLISLISLPRLLSRADRSIASTSLLLLWVTGVLSYFTQSRGTVYHMAPSYLALAAGQAVTLAFVASGKVRLGSWFQEFSIFRGLLLVALLGIGYRLFTTYQSLPLAVLRGDPSFHLEKFKAGDRLTTQEAVEFVRRIHVESSTDCMLVVGENSALNYLSGQRQPSRFYYFPVVANSRPPVPMAQRWTDLWLHDLQAANCRFALVAKTVPDAWLQGPSPAALALRRFLEQYRRIGSLGGHASLAVYERR